MNRFFYWKLAAQNIKKNAQFYIPYLLSLIGTISAFYILGTFADARDLPGLTRYTYLTAFMVIGMFVVAVFAVVFILYTNSFLMKRRGRELGLYNVLGMGKRHIALMLGIETVYTELIGLVGGIGLGLLLKKLMTMLLSRLIGLETMYQFEITLYPLLYTVVLFTLILLAALILNLFRVRVQKPVELLHSGSAGEREPKTRWLLALLGVLCLGGGYFLALWVQGAMEALAFYFVAVFLVIIGTYCLFTAVSIAILKLLRRNKRYYYQTTHFIGVSGMLYRMKRNAVGLANICILSTMVLVMVSGTLSLYLGTEDCLQTAYPTAFRAEVEFQPDENGQMFDGDKALACLSAAAEELDVPITHAYGVTDLGFKAMWTGACLTTGRSGGKDAVQSNQYVSFLTAADYTARTGKPLTLAEDEVLLACNWKDMGETLMLELRDYQTQEQVGVEYFTVRGTDADFETLPGDVNNAGVLRYVVVSDKTVLLRLWEGQRRAYGEDFSSYLRWNGMLDTEASEEAQFAAVGRSFADGSRHSYFGEGSLQDSNFIGLNDCGHWERYELYQRAGVREEFFQTNGGFFFLGLFLGFLFSMAAVLIIYYKQVSEGYEDRTRFQIMRQVGLPKREIRRSVDRQIVVVFFAPLLVAAVHVAFDFRLIRLMLTLFQLSNAALTMYCTLGTLAVFAILYGLVYRVTARAYYKIVE